jgi:hypothetical protein
MINNMNLKQEIEEIEKELKNLNNDVYMKKYQSIPFLKAKLIVLKMRLNGEKKL